ncbi:sporulation and spore germination [Trichococcus palustris]|uniref:Sporulation and spore germination n=1 Tax=Trichococcus palustris TaxID=140314 RepID=A0A143Z0F5_9LACT|nr:GerMN domain-containing protein [Trichococcus palustris]CZR00285.1 sporulation and spore germination [Trichococcus palustris]SFK89128.1 Sporulation and spore germination [Trichococcus palustris]
MKKITSIITISLLFSLLASCRGGATNDSAESSASSASISSSSAMGSSDSSSASASSSDQETVLTVGDFYPFTASVYSSYLGDGNEYASFKVYPQYIEGNRMQITSNNGGTQIVTVLENADGELKEVFSRPETYFRENMLGKTASGEAANQLNILLKEPLAVGNSWTNPNGTTSAITNTAAKVETPLGTFAALEVTTTYETSKTMNYYVKDLGLVKRVSDLGDGMVVSSSLETRTENIPETQMLRVYYPDSNVMGLDATSVELAYATNQITRDVLAAALKNVAAAPGGHVIGPNVTINSLALSDDGRVHVDFSQEFVSEMNAGSSAESLILQGVVNTIGEYYGVQEVYLTVAGKPYESGHILMGEGQYFTVDYSDVNQ